MDMEEAIQWREIDRETETMKRIVRSLRKTGSDLSLLKPILKNDKYSDDDLDNLFAVLLHDTPKSGERELCIQFVEALMRVPSGDIPAQFNTNYRAIALQDALCAEAPACEKPFLREGHKGSLV